MSMPANFKKFAPAIQQLPETDCLTREDLLTERFLMQKEGDLEMYYAPHNEYINQHSKVVIAGITPGWTQMEVAFQTAREGLIQEEAVDVILKQVKRAAGFAGTMRKNLIDMLDDCGLDEALQIYSCEKLFKSKHGLLHTTSAMKYPVFYKNKNYTGHVPKIPDSPLLSFYAYQVFFEELESIGETLIIPLGKSVSEVLKMLVNQGKLDPEHCLFGFPHPSGANGHRKRQFAKQKETLRRQIERYF